MQIHSLFQYFSVHLESPSILARRSALHVLSEKSSSQNMQFGYRVFWIYYSYPIEYFKIFLILI